MVHKNALSEKEFRSKFALGLRRARKAAGYTQEQVSGILGIKRSTYTYYELGKTAPSPYQIYRLLCLYNIAFEALVLEM